MGFYTFHDAGRRDHVQKHGSQKNKGGEDAGGGVGEYPGRAPRVQRMRPALGPEVWPGQRLGATSRGDPSTAAHPASPAPSLIA